MYVVELCVCVCVSEAPNSVHSPPTVSLGDYLVCPVHVGGSIHYNYGYCAMQSCHKVSHTYHNAHNISFVYVQASLLQYFIIVSCA